MYKLINTFVLLFSILAIYSSSAIVGTWVDENSSSHVWEFFEDNTMKITYTDSDENMYNYEILNTSPACGETFATSSGQEILRIVDPQDQSSETCYYINELTATRLVLKHMKLDETLFFAKQENKNNL